jgi:hypothetical protein
LADKQSWVDGNIERSKFEDQSQILQLGITDTKNLHNTIIGNMGPSSHKSYPTFYKVISLQLVISGTIKVTSRETYALLEYFGDIGGLH